MATQDISRFLLQPNKHYSTLHLQQGRVIVDSDWNERANAEAEDLRQTVLDIVCARGTPNDGFGITLAEPPAPDVDVALPTEDPDRKTYDFTLGAGSYYLGGMRLVIEDPDGENFLSQRDWLQLTSVADYMPLRPDPGDGLTTRVALVYLHAWEQPVTAVEDRELAEVALGGLDTSTRMKRMQRFEVLDNVGTSICADAFDNLIDILEEGTKAEYIRDTGELVSKGRLQVTYDPIPALEDPCADPTASGYVGADNQTIRVELRPGAAEGFIGKLIWGFDNASKLHRVQVSGSTVTFLTQPQDLSSIPRAGQVVEFLQWGAKLPNDEKVAEMQGLVTIATSTYNPESRQLEIAVSTEITATLTAWNQWLADHDEHYNDSDPTQERQFLYMRIWDRGSEVATASTALLDYSLNEPVSLGETGLAVTVVADGKDGDYWIIAARPSTPDVVTPWDLGAAVGAAPHGPRRFYAPLGLISVTNTAVNVTYSVQDCRTRLRKLCEGGACTVTVGDGKKSFGQFNDLQAAVDAVGNGSKICVLPGEYEGTTVIEDFSGLIIEGCGFRSVLTNPEPTASNTNYKVFMTPVISIKNSNSVFIRDLAITGYSAVGVEVAAEPGACRKIKLENLQITSTGGLERDAAGNVTSWRLPAPGITVADASWVEIVGCKVMMADSLGYSYAVVLGGSALSMRDCTILAPRNIPTESQAVGGVNIRSGSRNVEIIGCEIRGGRGHGIALGHGRVFGEEEQPSGSDVLGDGVEDGTGDTSVPPGGDPSACRCGTYTASFVGQATITALPLFFPAGAVEDVRIYDNRISDMGLSGISTAVFWPSSFTYGALTGVPLFIVVTDIDIARNVIENNVNVDEPASLFSNYDYAVGGVCLAASVNAWIHENTIRNNGKVVRTVPICGVGLVAAMNAVIEDNQIVDNGVAGAVAGLLTGLRGGIAVYEATAVRTKSKVGVMSTQQMPTFPTGTAAEVPWQGSKDWTGVSSQSAVTVRGNEVSQPLGRALWIARAFGPTVVTGNTLQSYGNPVRDDALLASFTWWINDGASNANGAAYWAAAGACVEISNYALLEEQTWAPIAAPPFPALEFVEPGADEIRGGSVLVTGNRMRLDWEQVGGYAASVLVQSIGAVVFNDNASELVTGNDFAESEIYELYNAVAGNQLLFNCAMTNVFVAGTGSVSLLGNRMTEPRWDALFSAVVAEPALALVDALVTPIAASLALGNVGSHCIIAPQGSSAPHIKADNVEIHPLLRVVTGATTTTYTCNDVEVSSTGGTASRVVGLSLTFAAP